jgi:hypothetical protein
MWWLICADDHENDKYGWILKKVAMDYLKVLFKHSPGKTEEKHK